MCRLRNLGVRRGEDRWLVRGLDVQIPRARLMAIVGPSGVGKSSLLKILAGSLPPGEGTVEYFGQSLSQRDSSGPAASDEVHPSRPDDFHARIGMVFQNFLLSENLPVLTNVMCGRLSRYAWYQTFFGFPGSDYADAQRFLDEMELNQYAYARVRDISGGEQQRVAIARALCQEPDIYLADEPVAHLDWPLARRVMLRLRRETTEHGRTVVAVMHDPALVEEFADIVLTISRDDPSAWTWKETSRP